MRFVLSCCQRTSIWLLVTSMVPTGREGQGHINHLTVRLKKRSKMRSSLCHPAPLLGGALEELQANGQTYVDLSSRPSPIRNGSLEKKTRHATTKFGSICDNLRAGCGGRSKEGRRNVSGEPFSVVIGLTASFEFWYSLNKVSLRNEGLPSFLLCHFAMWHLGRERES